MIELERIPVCRFYFPRFPIDETKILFGFNEDENEEIVKAAKRDYMSIKKYLLRQTYVPDKSKLDDQPNYKKLRNMDFKTFLEKAGMYSNVSENLPETERFAQAKSRYCNALRAEIKGYVKIFPKRDLKNMFTNNFNKTLIKIHPANHDIQFCCDPYSVAQYVVGYLSKNESGMSVLLKKVEKECSNLSNIEKISKLAAVLDKHREVSIQECVYRLLGLPMVKFSTKVKYLNTSHPKNRDGLLRRDICNLSDNDSVFYPSPHQYYENIPDEWPKGDETVYRKDTCLADWYSLYEYSTSKNVLPGAIELKNKMGWFKPRRERAVLRYYLAMDDEEDIARGLCILFLPFENEIKDIHDKNVIELVGKNHEVINNNRKKFEQNSLINDMIKRIEKEKDNLSNEESDDEREEETTERYLIDEHQEAYDKHDKQKAKDSLPKDETTLNFLDPVELRKWITSLNCEQRQLFDDIMERAVAGDLEDDPSFTYIGGGAGTGKSYLLQLMSYAIRQLKIKSGQDLDKPIVIVMAPTANAAFLIKGKTIESAMHINMERYNAYKKASAEQASKLAFEYEDVAVLFVDEISMVGTNKFTAIHYRMQDIAQGPKKKDFMGGRSFIATGDFQQLPPVLDQYVFKQSNLDGRSKVAPSHWNENFKIYYLTEKMRCPDDIVFAELCDRVGVGKITEEDENFLKSRVISETIPSEEVNENFTSGKIAIITTTNEKREEINLHKLRKLLPYEDEFICLAKDKITNRKNYIPIPDSVSYTKTHGMIKNLVIRKGAPVMVTVNHKVARYKEDGIVNGAKGYIDYIEMSRTNPDIVEIIWVVFQNEEVGMRCYQQETNRVKPKGINLNPKALPIFSIAKPMEVRQGNFHYMRKQYPLTLSYAMTCHKCQGSSLDEVIVDFRAHGEKKAFIDKGSFYVAITRVKEANKLYLRSFERKYIKVDSRIEYEINTMRKFRPYKMKKVYLNEQIFENGDEIKVGYLNINNLMDGFHAEYLNGDRNLKSLNLLAIAETHLTDKVSNESIESVLSNWNIKARYDATDKSKHMGLLLISPKESKFDIDISTVARHHKIDKNYRTQIQVISCSLGGYLFSFVYCRKSPNHLEADWIRQFTMDSRYVLGDLNLDPDVHVQKKNISVICGQQKSTLLNEITTNMKKQLDHILGVRTKDVIYFTSSFTNFVSDHKAITIRISTSGANFVDDPRVYITDKLQPNA